MEKNSQESDENFKNEDFTDIKIPYNLYQYISSGECNLQSMCRICLSTSNEMMYPLLSTKENSLLAIMFTELSSVQLTDDGLPSCICESCQIQVVQCYEFKSKCMKSDCLLRSILKNEFITKEEPTNDSVRLKEEERIQNIQNTEHETDLIEDVQYLEDFSDDASHNDTLQIIQNRTKRRKKAKVSITDSNSLLKEGFSAKKRASNKSKSYRCVFCSKKFSKAKTFHAHVKRNHANVKSSHPCSQCKESFDSEHDLLVHSALHIKGSTLKCNICHKEFKGRVAFRRHIKRHMECKRHACDACGKRFTELYALRRHIRVHTGQRVEKKHACHMCDKRYSSVALLAAHEARHAGLRPCACAACGKAFPSPRLLASHMLVHSDAKPYACCYCDRRFRHESTRNTHHRTHTGEKPYICSVCGKSFIQNSNLTLHMRTHTGERPYSCSMCDRKFTSGSSLKTHERIHTGERPYSCNICGKKFARMNLNSHMRLHTGERPYACNVCPKKFINASRLRDHCRIHTGEKPFECAVCTLKCATKAHLVKHVKIHESKGKKNLIVQNLEPQLHTNVIFKQYNEGSAPIATDTNESEHVILDAVPIDVTHEMPLEVTGELVVQDDSSNKTEYLVVDNSQNNNYQSDDVCVNDNNVNILSDAGDLNLVTVNEGEVSISTSNLEGTTVKLYQLDQSLVQIHSSGGQVTISKITSKMTANF